MAEPATQPTTPAPRDWSADLALARGVTAGPWYVTHDRGEVEAFHVEAADGTAIASYAAEGPAFAPDEDAEGVRRDFTFLAAAREGWPAALRELLRLRAELEAVAAQERTRPAAARLARKLLGRA